MRSWHCVHTHTTERDFLYQYLDSISSLKLKSQSDTGAKFISRRYANVNE